MYLLGPSLAPALLDDVFEHAARRLDRSIVLRRRALLYRGTVGLPRPDHPDSLCPRLSPRSRAGESGLCPPLPILSWRQRPWRRTGSRVLKSIPVGFSSRPVVPEVG